MEGHLLLLCGLNFISFSNCCIKAACWYGWKKTKSHIISARCGGLVWNSTPDEACAKTMADKYDNSLCPTHTHMIVFRHHATHWYHASRAVKVEQFGKNSWLTLPIRRTNTHAAARKIASRRARPQTNENRHAGTYPRERITHITNTQSVAGRGEMLSARALAAREQIMENWQQTFCAFDYCVMTMTNSFQSINCCCRILF